MAKKSQPNPEPNPQAEESAAVVTGTSRVIAGGEIRIPEPLVPKTEEAPAKSDKPKKESTARSSAIVPPIHLDLVQSRNGRLLDLARRNRDVKWLLDEYNKLLKPETK